MIHRTAAADVPVHPAVTRDRRMMPAMIEFLLLLSALLALFLRATHRPAAARGAERR